VVLGLDQQHNQPFRGGFNHDANTIFLTAILIATIVALAGGEIQPAEAYIMLLLSSGFVFTVLSFLGLRLHFLRPSTTRTFRGNLCTTIKNLVATFRSLGAALKDLIISLTNAQGVRAKQQSPLIATIKRLVKSAHLTFGLKSFSKLKHPALSWAGVVARCAIGTFSAVVGILVWWEYSTQPLPDGAGFCIPTFFFFGVRSGTGSMLWFFRIAAILLTIPVAYPLGFAISFLLEFGTMGEDWLLRYGIIKMAETIKPGAWDSLSDDEKESLRAFLTMQKLISADQPAAVTTDPRPLLHLLRSINDRDADTLPPLAGAPRNQISSISEQSSHGSLPHNHARGSRQTNVLTDATRTTTFEAVSRHSANAQEAPELIAVAEEHQRHLGSSESHHARGSGRTQDKSSWQIKASELPRFSMLLQSFMSLWTRGIETDIGPGTEEVEPE
jgi:hypothetical protein